MSIAVRLETPDALEAYAQIPIAFEVRSLFDVMAPAHGLGGITLSERVPAAPYVKDYDAEGNGPTRWPERFDLSGWGIFAGYADRQRVGGAVVAFGSADVEMLENRQDLAVLWDLRILPEARRRGVGTALFRAATAWAAARGCRHLKVETQNVNVPACRFYVRQGCVLGGIHRFAYPALPHETQLLWYKALP